MPNYSLLINSEFKPYSFDELVKPFQMYAQAYNEVDSAYNTLGTNAGALESVLNQERDKAAWGQYNAYMQGLNDAATELATKGLSPAARTQVGNLTKQYAQNIVPIQKAAETWQKQIEEQRKAGDSKINSYNANTLSIDKFLENPQLSYETIDKGNLMKTSTAYFSQMAKQARDIEARKLYDKNGKYTYERDFIEEYGVTPQEIISFQNDMERALQTGDKNAVQYVIAIHPELGTIADKVFKGTKASAWDPNSEGVAETWNTIIGSSIAAMGETKHNLRQDSAGLKWLDYSISKRKNDEKLTNPIQHSTPNIIPLRDTKEIGEQQSKHDKWVSMGYLTKDGRLTPKGRDNLYRRKINSNISQATTNSVQINTGSGYVTTTPGAAIFSGDRGGYSGNPTLSKKKYTFEPTAFGKYMEEVTGSNFIKEFDENTGTVTYDVNTKNMSAYRQHLENIKPENYDVYRTSEVVYNIEDSEQKPYASAIISSLPAVNKKGEQYLEEVRYSAKEQSFIPTGNKIKIDPQNIDKYKVTQLRGSNKGQTAVLQTPEGSKVRVSIPIEMNMGMLSPYTTQGGKPFIGTIPSSFNRIDVYNEILDKGKMPIMDMTTGRIVTDEEGHIAYSDDDLTPEMRAYFNERLSTEWDANQQYFGNIFTTIKTQPISIKPNEPVVFH